MKSSYILKNGMVLIMYETNEEICQKLKTAIHDHYMGYIRPKLNYLFSNNTESEISNQIMQFLDAQIDTENSIITKDDITRILNSVLIDEEDNFSNTTLKQSRISHCFPIIATVSIENGEAAFLLEQTQTLFNGIEEKSYYLYMSPNYYSNNIRRYRK